MKPRKNDTEKSDIVMAGLRYLSRKPSRNFSHEEIATACGVTKSTVFDMEQKALVKLRRLLSNHGISR